LTLRWKIFFLFTAIFLVSNIILLGAVFSLLERQNAVFVDPQLEGAVSKGIDLLQQRDDSELNEVFLTISRQYGMYRLLRRDFLYDALSFIVIWTVIQIVVLMAAAAVLSRNLTANLNHILKGVHSIRSGNRSYVFSAMKDREFGAVSESLNALLAEVKRQQAMLVEQSKFLGWQEVAAFLSHQLKNPLTSVRMAAENLRLGSEVLDEKQIRSLEIISSEISRVNALSARMKQLAEFPKIERVKVNLLEYLKNIQDSFHAADIQLINIPEGQFSFDPELMEQVFKNLIVNSIEASDKKVKITIACIRTEHQLNFNYSDSITGLPIDLADKVMEPKFTTKTSGTGIGLPMARKIVILHDGEWEVSQSESGGLQFAFSIRINPIDGENSEEPK
jgi:two-component system nitrogen regulation sensor histidine kinase NtrY